jgi:hypothetical protein
MIKEETCKQNKSILGTHEAISKHYVSFSCMYALDNYIFPSVAYYLFLRFPNETFNKALAELSLAWSTLAAPAVYTAIVHFSQCHIPMND